MCKTPEFNNQPSFPTTVPLLQVTKIQYINKRAHYEKAVISVEDHAGCRCQTHPSASASRTMVQQTPTQNTPPPPPPRLPLVPLPKARSKEELHRHDDLKYNQRFHLEDREQLERQWQSKYTLSHTQTQPQPRIHTLAGVHTQGGTHTLSQAQTGGTHTQVGHLPERQDEGYIGGVLSREGGGRETPLGHGSGYEERGSHTRHHTQHHTGEGQHGDTTERTLAVERQQQIHQYQQQQQQQYQQQYQHNQQQYPQPSQHQYQHDQQQHQQQSRGPTTEDRHLRTQHMHDTPQSDSSSPPDIKTPHDTEQHPHHSSDRDHRLTEQNSEKDSVAKVANMDAQRDITDQRRTETEAIASRQEKDKERHSQTESANHQHRDSGLTNQERSVTEEERRQKRLEILQREQEDRPQHHHHPLPQDQQKLQTQPQTTTQSTGTRTFTFGCV